MFTLFIITPIILVILGIRLLLRALGFGRRFRRPFMGFGDGYNNGFGNGYGCHRHHRFGGGLFTLLALVALDRLFTRRF